MPQWDALEHAKSGRAACRACGAKIAKGAVRVGSTTFHDVYGEMTAWRHFSCVPALHSGSRAAKVPGFTGLRADCQAAIRNHLPVTSGPTFGADDAAVAAAGRSSSQPIAAATPPLPQGWKEATDPKTGKKYYYNAETKATTWTRPELEVAPSQTRSPARPGVAMSQPTPARPSSMLASPARPSGTGGTAEGDTDDTFFGLFDTEIVGCRYYAGAAHKGEYVALEREPNNPYDGNAVRVLNCENVQVGHIRRQVAVGLAKIMDVASMTPPRCEGTIPRDAWNAFTLPLVVRIYGAAEDRAWAVQTMRRVGVVLREESSGDAGGGGGGGGSGGGGGGGARGAAYVRDPAKSQRELDALFDELAKAIKISDLPYEPKTETPALMCNLRKHQRDGIAWMLSRERQPSSALPTFYEERKEGGKAVFFNTVTSSSTSTRPKPVLGGLLADDMGNGKTVQTLAVVLANPPPGVTYGRAGHAAAAVADDDDDASGEPSVADIVEEVMRSAKRALSAAFAGAADAPPPPSTLPPGLAEALAELGVTSPEALQQRTLAELKPICKIADTSPWGTKAKVAMRIWKVVTDGGGLPTSPSTADAAPPAAKKRKTGQAAAAAAAAAATVAPWCGGRTLIVCPMGVMENWRHQVEEHVSEGTLRVLVWHGADRHARADELCQADVVITSYATLTGELDASRKAALGITWHRAVLDEAHTIRNRQTKGFRAVNEIRSVHRWCLTGTPLQNKADDVFGLLSFLKCQPLDDWPIFNRAIARPIRDGDDRGLAQLRLILKTVSIRRGKAVLGAELPPKKVIVQKVRLDAAHRSLYDPLYASARHVVEAALESGVASDHYLSILELITRLRQAVCASTLVPAARVQQAQRLLELVGGTKSKAKELTTDEVRDLFGKLKEALCPEDEEAGSFECAVCLNPQGADEVCILRDCRHAFCERCVDTILQTDPHARSAGKGGKARCPLCRALFGKADCVSGKELQAKAADAEEAAAKAPVPTTATAEDSDGAKAPPPKVAALLEILAEIPPGESAVVFSGFTQFLDVIETELRKAGYVTARIDGTKTATQRAAAQDALRRGEARVLLVSTRAGGVGLNLVRANHVVMADLWWNAAVDEQAWDRCHRLGQTRPVTVTRLIAEDSVEERILELQEAKQALGTGALRKLTPQEAVKARLSDIRKLFSME